MSSHAEKKLKEIKSSFLKDHSKNMITDGTRDYGRGMPYCRR